MAALNASRGAVLDAPGAVTAAATALDGADEACATGNRELAADARATAHAAAAAGDAALAALPDRLATYRADLAALAEAGSALEPPQAQPLSDVVEAGEREAAAQEDFLVVARAVRPSYDALDQAQTIWLERASAGWYRDRREAANAYAVLREPVAAELDEARSALADADAARRPPTEAMRAALAAADAALAPLRGRPAA